MKTNRLSGYTSQKCVQFFFLLQIKKGLLKPHGSNSLLKRFSGFYRVIYTLASLQACTIQNSPNVVDFFCFNKKLWNLWRGKKTGLKKMGSIHGKSACNNCLKYFFGLIIRLNQYMAKSLAKKFKQLLQAYCLANIRNFWGQFVTLKCKFIFQQNKFYLRLGLGEPSNTKLFELGLQFDRMEAKKQSQLIIASWPFMQSSQN